jgi:GMP synthase-like glutamine amidotransferase
LRIAYFQHVPFEGPAAIQSWADLRGHGMVGTRLFENEALPDIGSIDWLTVLGGPMNIYEDENYPWLKAEKAFIGLAVAAGKIVLGVCLGAQLIADALGSRVFRSERKEIGWFPIEPTQEAKASGILGGLPERPLVFHWHGDTFDLPPGSVRLARSEACENQAFIRGDRVLGLQFHLESTREGVRDLVDNCGDELIRGAYVQEAEEILSADDGRFAGMHRSLFGILDRLSVSPRG